jgi:hypothetical protein
VHGSHADGRAGAVFAPVHASSSRPSCRARAKGATSAHFDRVLYRLGAMATSTPPTITCPSCSAQASGRFCASCGAPLAGATCSSCHASLTPGARFCHLCGTPAGTASAPAPHPADRATNALPWAVAAIALVALIALVAGQRFGRAPAAADTGERVADAPPAAAAGPAPDISTLSPRERAERLYDRIMRLDAEGKKDSVAFFAQMAIAAYQMIPDQDADTHYDMGRIAEVAGAYPLAKLAADSILGANPTHLLGLALGMRVARDVGDTKTADALASRLLAADSSERAKQLPEYERHAEDLKAALEEARKQGR